MSAHKWIGDSLSSSYCCRCGKDARDGAAGPCVTEQTGCISDCIDAAESSWRIFACRNCDRSGDRKAARARADLARYRALREAVLADWEEQRRQMERLRADIGLNASIDIPEFVRLAQEIEP